MNELNVAYRGTVEEVSQRLMDAATALSKLPRDAEQPTRIPSNHSEFGRRLTAYGTVPNAAKQAESVAMKEAQESLKAGEATWPNLRACSP